MTLEKKANVTYEQAEAIINITFESMIKALYNDDKIEIRGFGSLANRNYKPYEGRNPRSGQFLYVSAKKVPFCKVSKELKDMVNAGKDKYEIRDF